MLQLSVVCLCYRAEELVPRFVQQMKQLLDQEGIRYELILVANYDASTGVSDRTPEIVKNLTQAQPSLKSVILPKEGGMGWDLRTGLALAQGEVIAYIDADGQVPQKDVVTVYKKLTQEKLDVALTYRTKRFDGKVRFLISKIYNSLLRLLFPSVKVRDANATPKVLTRSALKRLPLAADGWFIDAEMIILASAQGMRIGEVPTEFYRNEFRESFVDWRAVVEFLYQMCRQRLRLKPNQPSETQTTTRKNSKLSLRS